VRFDDITTTRNIDDTHARLKRCFERTIARTARAETTTAESRKRETSKTTSTAFRLPCVTLILLFPRLTPVESPRLFFFASHRQEWKRVQASLTPVSPLPLSSVRGKRFFPQFPRDCLLRKFSTPIDCPPPLGQIIFIIFLGARPLAVRATLWPPRNETAQPPAGTALHLLAVNFY